MRAIVAIDDLWGIGNNGNLLFKIREDMQFFKKITTGKVVIMGRKTLDSLPNGEPLENRINLVITSEPREDYNNVIFGDIDKINEVIKNYDTNNIFVIGGESIYEQFLHRCDTVYVTHNKAIYKADTHMPNLAFEGFIPKQVVDQGINAYGEEWVIEEWVTSECQPYNSVLWFNDLNNKILFLYHNDDSEYWKKVYSGQFYKLRNDFKIRLLQFISSNDLNNVTTKINNYYRSEIHSVKGNNVLRLASFGATEKEAEHNLIQTITELLA